jgi:hypothetical protein
VLILCIQQTMFVSLRNLNDISMIRMHRVETRQETLRNALLSIINDSPLEGEFKRIFCVNEN